MKTGENENIRRHREYTLNLMNQVIGETKHANFKTFKENEQLKEMVFSQLQEIGEAAREIVDITDDEDMEAMERDVFQRLSLLKNVRYNQQAETGILQAWNIAKFDLPEMEEELMHY